jgi:hypothetical protein
LAQEYQGNKIGTETEKNKHVDNKFNDDKWKKQRQWF